MQKFITSDKFQEPFKRKTRYNLKADISKPSPEVIKRLMAYAAALHVFTTKSVGNANILMN